MNLKQRKRNWPLYYEITKPTRFVPGGLKTYWAVEWEALPKSRQPADGPARRDNMILLSGEGEAKKKLIATHAKLEISPTHSKRSTSLFLIATKNPLREFPRSLHWTVFGSLQSAILRALGVSAVENPGPACLSPSVPLPYYGAVQRGVAVISESKIGRKLHGD